MSSDETIISNFKGFLSLIDNGTTVFIVGGPISSPQL